MWALTTRTEIAILFACYTPNGWGEFERRWQLHRKRDHLAEWRRKQEQAHEVAHAKRCMGKIASGSRCRRDALTNNVMCGIHIMR